MNNEQQNSTLNMLMHYKLWADKITYNSVLKLPAHEITKIRETNFKTIVHTLNHIYVVEDIFKSHLTGVKHSYTTRNTAEAPDINDLWFKEQEMNDWYLNFVKSSSSEELSKRVEFEFVGGGEGVMTKEEIILHIVNHATYHRGFVSDMMYQVPARMQANDLPVFLRDEWNR